MGRTTRGRGSDGGGERDFRVTTMRVHSLGDNPTEPSSPPQTPMATRVMHQFLPPSTTTLSPPVMFLLAAILALNFVNLFLANNRLQLALAMFPMQSSWDWYRVITAPLATPRSLLALLVSIYLAPSVLGPLLESKPYLVFARSVCINLATLLVFKTWWIFNVYYLQLGGTVNHHYQPWCGLLALIVACQTYAPLASTDASNKHVPLLPFTVSAKQEPFAWALVFTCINGGDLDLAVAAVWISLVEPRIAGLTTT
jgi:hypothetical protein